MQRALETMLPAELLRVTRVEALEQGMLTISVSDHIWQERVRRRIPQLRKQLAVVVPGLQAVRLSAAPQLESGQT